MMSEQVPEPADRVKKRPTKNRIIFSVVLLIVAYLTGFLPGYAKGQRQQKELSEARQENSLAQLRDLACPAYLQAIQKNYGLAAGTSTRLFDQTREVANQTLDSAGRNSLEDVLSLRDPITAKPGDRRFWSCKRLALFTDEDPRSHSQFFGRRETIARGAAVDRMRSSDARWSVLDSKR